MLIIFSSRVRPLHQPPIYYCLKGIRQLTIVAHELSHLEGGTRFELANRMSRTSVISGFYSKAKAKALTKQR